MTEKLTAEELDRLSSWWVKGGASNTELGLLLRHISALTAELSQAREEIVRLQDLAQDRFDQLCACEEARAEIAAWKRQASEASEYVESPLVMRTGFTGEEPYVGWKGLGLALTEALDERDRLRATLDATRSDIEWLASDLRKITRPEWVDNLVARIARIDAAVPRPPAQAVAVRAKSLVWRRDATGSMSAWAYGGPCHIDRHPDGLFLTNRSGARSVHETETDAVAFLQKKHAGEVLSAIDARPVDAVKAEALREMASCIDLASIGREDRDFSLAVGMRDAAHMCRAEANRLDPPKP